MTAARKPPSARGLFLAMCKAARPVMVDPVDGEAVYDAAPEREANDFYPTPPEPIRALLLGETRFLTLDRKDARQGELFAEALP